jgi:parvulin-like peptidyl-prolyl isomerase
VRASEVARFLFRFDPGRALEGLNQILDERILRADAAALGITLPPGEVEARTEEQVRSRETEIRVQYGPEVTLERYLRERFGFTPEGFRKDTEALVRLQALRDRVVRFEASRQDRIRIRVLVLKDEAEAREAARRLREGADFSALARQVSLAPAEDLPPYRREDVQPPALGEELFALAAGEISRPVRVAKEGREVFEVFKVVETLPGRDLPWAGAAEGIERGLRTSPVTPAEYLQWARRARERHGVKVLLEEPGAGGGGR